MQNLDWRPNIRALGMLMAGLLAAFLLIEHGLFRFVLVPDDGVGVVSIRGVARYAAKARAIMRHADGSQSLVTINGDGWNSTKPVYPLAKTPGRVRVAVIGDRYVHARLVDGDKSFPEVIERELNDRGVDAEVFRFGMEDAPLSQHLQVLRREVVSFRPDIVVVNVDTEALRVGDRGWPGPDAPGGDGSKFLQLATDPVGRIIEVQPLGIKRTLADRLRGLRTVRYADALLDRGGEWCERTLRIAAKAGAGPSLDLDTSRTMRYVLLQFKRIALENGIRIVLVTNGVRDRIYAGHDPHAFQAGKHDQALAALAFELGLAHLDLHAAFARDWQQHQTRFEFPLNWQWNELGHDLAGTETARYLLRDERMLGQRPLASRSLPNTVPVSAN